MNPPHFTTCTCVNKNIPCPVHKLPKTSPKVIGDDSRFIMDPDNDELKPENEISQTDSFSRKDLLKKIKQAGDQDLGEGEHEG